MNEHARTVILIVTLVLIAGAISFLQSGKAEPATAAPVVEVAGPEASSTAPLPSGTAERIAAKTKLYERAKEITTPDGFINTDGKPVSLSDYVGKKVVLLDIWTYSCINCLRTLPYLNDWYKKYEDKGLVIIGLQTPEFDFEKNIDNVKAAVEKYGIKFPVVLDNDFSTWMAYRNLYWPRKYLIDIDGFIRYDHIGEGGYDETEQQIQGLLKERADVLGEKVSLDMPLTKGAQEAPSGYESPETYFGSARNQYFGNGTPGMDMEKDFSAEGEVSLGKFYLNGRWSINSQYAESAEEGASIVYPFVAGKVYLVASADSPARALILVDDKPVGVLKGDDVEDVNGQGVVTVSGSRLYSIVSGVTGTTPHMLEIRALDKGLKAFTLTFGS